MSLARCREPVGRALSTRAPPPFCPAVRLHEHAQRPGAGERDGGDGGERRLRRRRDGARRQPAVRQARRDVHARPAARRRDAGDMHVQLQPEVFGEGLRPEHGRARRRRLRGRVPGEWRAATTATRTSTW